MIFVRVGCVLGVVRLCGARCGGFARGVRSSEIELVGGMQCCNSVSEPHSAFGSTRPVDQLEISARGSIAGSERVPVFLIDVDDAANAFLRSLNIATRLRNLHCGKALILY